MTALPKAAMAISLMLAMTGCASRPPTMPPVDHVDLDKEHPIVGDGAKRRRSLCAAYRVSVSQHNISAFLGKPLGRRPTDTARATGDQCHPAREPTFTCGHVSASAQDYRM